VAGETSCGGGRLGIERRRRMSGTMAMLAAIVEAFTGFIGPIDGMFCVKQIFATL